MKRSLVINLVFASATLVLAVGLIAPYFMRSPTTYLTPVRGVVSDQEISNHSIRTQRSKNVLFAVRGVRGRFIVSVENDEIIEATKVGSIVEFDAPGEKLAAATDGSLMSAMGLISNGRLLTPKRTLTTQPTTRSSEVLIRWAVWQAILSAVYIFLVMRVRNGD